MADTSTAPAREVSEAGRLRKLLPGLFLAAIWSAIYVPGLFYPALLDDADSVHAEVAREMVERHDWITMYVNGIRYLEKQPLMYWAIAAAYRLAGVSEWTARLPVALAFLGLLLIVYRLGLRAYGRQGAFYAALVLATSAGPYLFTRFLIPDIVVGLWLAAAVALFLKTLEQSRPHPGTRSLTAAPLTGWANRVLRLAGPRAPFAGASPPCWRWAC